VQRRRCRHEGLPGAGTPPGALGSRVI
jgi:hypothetical protein